MTLPDEGAVSVLGMNPREDSVTLRRMVGYVPEQPGLYEWMTVEEIGRFVSVFHKDGYWLRYCELIESYRLPMRSKISTLSKGMKAEVSLALALAADPPLLVLDEPTSGLDVMVRHRFLESMVDLAAVGKTVFLSSHQIAEVERIADTVAIMKKSVILLVEPLESLKATSRTYRITFEKGAEESDAISGQKFMDFLDTLFHPLIDRQTEGREMKILARHPAEDACEQLARYPGIVEVEEKSPTLEEIFVAYMKSNC